MKKLIVSSVLAFITFSAQAAAFQVTSNEIKTGEQLTTSHVFSGFGCEGGNTSPSLTWSGAPEGTKSFAVTVYDPDAPTGSGWWHWTVANIPATVTYLPADAGRRDGTKLPTGAVQGRNEDPAHDGEGAARRHLPHRIRLHLPGPDPDRAAAGDCVLLLQQVHHRRCCRWRREGIILLKSKTLPGKAKCFPGYFRKGNM